MATGAEYSPASQQPLPYQEPKHANDSQSTWKGRVSNLSFHLRLSHLWFSVFSIGSIALSIAVVASCGDPKQSANGLVVLKPSVLVRHEITDISHDDGYFGLDELPDTYYFGLAGLCRDRDDKVTCQRQFPSHFNFIEHIAADLDNETMTERWDTLLHPDMNSNADVVTRLSTAAAALLISSILIGTISTGIVMCSQSGFSGSAIFLLILDSVLLLAALCLWIAIFSCTLGMSKIPGLSFNEVVGIGSWLLLAAFLCRLLSQPVLLVGFLALLLFLALLPCMLLAACCSSRKYVVYNSWYDRYEVYTRV